MSLCRLVILAGLLALPFAAPAATAVDESKIIYPKAGAAAAPSAAPAGSLGSATTIVGALVLAAGGVWLLLRRRADLATGRATQSLAISETRSLGNRQFLVVASYEGRKFLLGVCPGRIEMLAPLDAEAAPKAQR
jgi:flagellar protein FliO/FliZ